MEANIKENQITFSKGMSNVPSDNLCDDNSLSDCVGLRMKDGELHPVQSPKELGALGGDLLFVHKTAAFSHLVYHSGGSLYWVDRSGIQGTGTAIDISSVTSETQVRAIGNTLIVNTTAGLSYAVWRDGGYKVITRMPSVSIAVRSCDDGKSFLPEDYTTEDTKKAMETLRDGARSREENEETVLAARNEVVGIIEGAYKKACKNGYFTFPFWLRVALRLYDGSYAMISPPVLAFPSVRRAAFITLTTIDDDEKMTALSANHSTRMEVMLTKDGSFEDLAEIVDKIVIFASDQVKTWGDDGSNPLQGNGTLKQSYLWWDTVNKSGQYESKNAGNTELWEQDITGTFGTGRTTSYKGKKHYFAPPYNLTDDEIIDKLVSTSVFYKIAEAGVNGAGFDDWVKLDTMMKRGVLEDLTTQEQLEHDDYYGHCQYMAGSVYTFNNRLHIANVTRFPWQGSYHQTSYEESGLGRVGMVKIEGASGTIYANVTTYSNVNNLPNYFFYPDPRASEVYFDGGGEVFKLKSHPRLNGAYYFSKLPPDNAEADESGQDWSYATGGGEELPTKVMTSEVNNPWVFNAEGDNTVGTGWIVGMVSNTRALSQGQFGQHPLIVFTSEGIYALGTNSEGLYSTNYPLSREVCNNPKSITPTDGAVFFTSEKGLMMMVGSEITCVSQQMMGKTDAYSPDSLYSPDSRESGHGYSKEAVNFHDFLKDCVIAYDYRDYCLYLINTAFTYHYVYDIKSGAITRQDAPASQYQRVVNDYPDNLLQDSDETVWSLINKDEPNADGKLYNGILLSRPCKMGDAQTLKSPRQVLHVMDLHDGASVKLHIYVSNDLKHWGELKSLKGCGWKYFRFGLAFSNLKATDSYSGLLAITQNRRADKLR